MSYVGLTCSPSLAVVGLFRIKVSAFYGVYLLGRKVGVEYVLKTGQRLALIVYWEQLGS